MKRILSIVLLICLLGTLLFGCARSGPSGIAPTVSVTTPSVPVSQMHADEVVSLALGHTVSSDSFYRLREEVIDGETVIHYDQAYKGVEVLGSSVVVVAGEEMQTIGVHYDFSEAFGDDFEDLVQEASQMADWMADETYVRYDPNTLRPVIFLDGETPVVARSFDVIIYGNRYSLVTDLDGEYCYSYTTNLTGFNSTQTQGGTFVAEENGNYYAYDMEHKVYIASITDITEDKFDDYYDGTGAVVKENLIYRLQGNAGDETYLKVLGAMGDVMGWYADNFGYQGVDGKGGEAMILLGASASSIAANGSEYGHVFVLPIREGGETAADAPEILAHEMGHAMLRNKVGLVYANESAAIHEAISDVLASLYDPDNDWKVGDGLKTASYRDITTFNRTMADFWYDYRYFKDDWDVIPDDKVYMNEHNPYAWIQKAFIYGEKSSTNCAYHNAEIVSGTMHKIWRDVFQKDNRFFGEVLWDSLQYLPKTADFAQFRAAFMYSTRKLAGGETARRVGMLFDTVGIYHNPDNFAVIQEKATPDTLLEMLDKTFGDVRAMPWDSCDFTDMEDQWYCFCEKDGYSLNFTYEGSNEADPQALPVSLDLFYYNDDEPIDPVPVAKGLKFGMNYGEIGEKFDISPLENTEYAGSEYPVIARIETEKYSIVLLFDGVDENALFNGVTIMKK